MSTCRWRRGIERDKGQGCCEEEEEEEEEVVVRKVATSWRVSLFSITVECASLSNFFLISLFFHFS